MKAFLHPLGLLVLGLLAGAPVRGGAPEAPPPARSQPLLEVEQTLPPAIEPGALVPVEIRVRNVGAQAAEDVKVIDVLPAGYQVRDTSIAPARLPGSGTGTCWQIGTLPAGEEFGIQLILQPTGTAGKGPLLNSVEATCRVSARSAGRISVLAPDLALEAGPTGEVFLGMPARLTLTIRNQGTVAARHITLQTLLPPGLVHPNGSDLESDLAPLAAGESQVVPLTVTPQRAGEWSIRFSLHASGMAPVVRDLRVVVQDVRLSASFRGPESLEQQFTGLYELTVRNEGTTSARPVNLVVWLPEGLSFLRATAQGRYEEQNRILRWNLGELRPREVRTVVWNGMAQKAGDLEGKVWVQCGSRTCDEKAWRTRVGPEEKDLPR
jgi:uncharacterized repeat protein (TIGR01451 family)